MNYMLIPAVAKACNNRRHEHVIHHVRRVGRAIQAVHPVLDVSNLAKLHQNVGISMEGICMKYITPPQVKWFLLCLQTHHAYLPHQYLSTQGEPPMRNVLFNTKKNPDATYNAIITVSCALAWFNAALHDVPNIVAAISPPDDGRRNRCPFIMEDDITWLLSDEQENTFRQVLHIL